MRRDEFQLKSKIEALSWEMSVKKADPQLVRSGLQAINAPTPAIASRH